MKTLLKKIIRYRRNKQFGSVGNNVEIAHGYFGQAQKIVFGDNVYIGPGSTWAGLGGIKICNNVIIGPNSTIWSHNHNYKDARYLPYDEIEILDKVTIEDNVWIGIGVFIVPGVTIGEGAIVGMGSVVTKSIPPLSIVGGNPAKIIGKRDLEHYTKLKEDKCSYLTIKEKLVKTQKVNIK